MVRFLQKNRKWFWSGIVLVELILFYSSSMTYEEQTSVPFLEKYLKGKPLSNFLKTISFRYGGKQQSLSNDGYYNFVEFFIRKGAHFGTYFVLGILLCLALYLYFEKNLVLQLFIPWMTTTGLAAFDEFHQGLTGGRTPSVVDVILDSSGAITGILIIILVLYLVSKHENKLNYKF
ncbi:VanZ family protein [Companilactobacillus halodurans]|uniref:VanZ family protein n=1 Tax=Companilactobacillus halodurans TaxID=2584183 RepID=A0A5P0ZRW5_9LACO|nr:VanZ family protein [Companilactobacillus halodurans]MQS76805.1 VanZ family protein [Companilactobacillus halodurans]MQS98246.1 VanZ family protein [Companilactobacillus halodurans]